ncbi:metallophosphoesterase [Eubacterium ventriosum]|jgi:serine/threonine protein phosphatase 1|uniref:metallophosphoesterase n=1 Tax=Eubacterium ventriosum TaxID=39496 RepID=UPI003AB11CED
MIYAMSDIHGCIDELKEKMEKVDIAENNRIVFLGDYMDYGDNSYQVLKYLKDLQGKYGVEKVIVLRGNHEQMFLEWINDYRNPYPDGSEDNMVFNDWLRTDLECGGNTISTFLSQWQMDFLNQISRTSSMETINREAVQMILSNHDELIEWIQRLPSYFETENQIFVHAGVDEEAGEYWMWGTSDSILLGKFPATKGKFYKTIVAGHVGTGSWSLADNRNYHDVFYDGESHYYIDGSVYIGGKLLLLAYNEENGKYYQVENGKMIPVSFFDKYK